MLSPGQSAYGYMDPLFETQSRGRSPQGGALIMVAQGIVLKRYPTVMPALFSGK